MNEDGANQSTLTKPLDERLLKLLLTKLQGNPQGVQLLLQAYERHLGHGGDVAQAGSPQHYLNLNQAEQTAFQGFPNISAPPSSANHAEFRKEGSPSIVGFQPARPTAMPTNSGPSSHVLQPPPMSPTVANNHVKRLKDDLVVMKRKYKYYLQQTESARQGVQSIEAQIAGYKAIAVASGDGRSRHKQARTDNHSNPSRSSPSHTGSDLKDGTHTAVHRVQNGANHNHSSVGFGGHIQPKPIGANDSNRAYLPRSWAEDAVGRGALSEGNMPFTSDRSRLGRPNVNPTASDFDRPYPANKADEQVMYSPFEAYKRSPINAAPAQGSPRVQGSPQRHHWQQALPAAFDGITDTANEDVGKLVADMHSAINRLHQKGVTLHQAAEIHALVSNVTEILAVSPQAQPASTEHVTGLLKQIIVQVNKLENEDGAPVQGANF